MKLRPSTAQRLIALDPLVAHRIVCHAQQARNPDRYVLSAVRRAEVTRWRQRERARRRRIRQIASALRTAERELGYELVEAECYARLKALRLSPSATAADVVAVQAAILRAFEGATDAELWEAVGGRTRSQRYQWVRRGLLLLETGCTTTGCRRLEAPDRRTARWIAARAWRSRPRQN